MTLSERRAKQRAYYHAHRERMQAQNREWRRQHPERVRQVSRDRYQRRKIAEYFGLTPPSPIPRSD